MIVTDTGILVAALALDTPTALRCRERLRDVTIVVPEMLDLEFINVLRKLIRAARIGEARAHRALDELRTSGIRRISHHGLMERIWELRNNLSPYDAAFVAAAEGAGASLLTADARMSRAPGLRCEVEVLS